MTSASESHPGSAVLTASRAGARSVDDRVLVICGLSVGAGLIHAVASVQHLDEYLLFSLFFAALAIAQLAWGVVLYRAPSPRLMTIGAVACVLVVLLWIASRTIGLPIGPERWTPEGVGVIDSVASADELMIAILIVFQLSRVPSRPLAVWLRRIATGLGVWLIMLSSLALVGVKHVH